MCFPLTMSYSIRNVDSLQSRWSRLRSHWAYRATAATAKLTVIIALGALAGYGGGELMRQWQQPGPTEQGDYSAYYQTAGAHVVLFSTSTCPYCKQAREYLAERGVPYKDFVVDESKDSERLFGELGESGVPVLLAGDTLVRGFNPKAYAAALAQP